MIGEDDRFSTARAGTCPAISGIRAIQPAHFASIFPGCENYQGLVNVLQHAHHRKNRDKMRFFCIDQAV